MTARRWSTLFPALLVVTLVACAGGSDDSVTTGSVLPASTSAGTTTTAASLSTVAATAPPADTTAAAPTEIRTIDELVAAMRDAGVGCDDVELGVIEGAGGSAVPFAGEAATCASDGVVLQLTAFPDQANFDAAQTYVASVLASFDITDAPTVWTTWATISLDDRFFTPAEAEALAGRLGWAVRNGAAG